MFILNLPQTKRRGRYKKRAILILALFFAPVFVVAAPCHAEQAYTPVDLTLTAYTDGYVRVEYFVDVDPNYPRANITLFGRTYENLIIVNENGTPLDYSTREEGVVIDTLGAGKTKISYITLDLTNKSGRIWIFSVKSPINFNVILPRGSTVISLSQVPIAIKSLDGQYLITMPFGQQEIAYVIGILGTKEHTLVLINEAQVAIEKAQQEGRTEGLTDAEQLLQQARDEYAKGNYQKASQLAEQAKTEAQDATAPLPTPVPTPTTPYTWISIGLIIAMLILAASLLLRRRRPVSIPREKRVIDVDKILQECLWLRSEDREAIQFIAECGGEALEAEIRERFKLPKTTVWRMIRRLQREGIAEVRKIGGQNRIRIKDKDPIKG